MKHAIAVAIALSLGAVTACGMGAKGINRQGALTNAPFSESTVDGGKEEDGGTDAEPDLDCDNDGDDDGGTVVCDGGTPEAD